jgi:outer membrane murein-binding lipoprotein Lpp
MAMTPDMAEMPTPEMETEMMTPPEGDVTMTISKSQFDNLNSLVQELASALSAMSSSVDMQEAAGAEEAAPKAEEAADMADLDMFAKELSARTRA